MLTQVNLSPSFNFGTTGSGDTNFSFPVGICANGDRLYIIDRQNHRVKIHNLVGDFIGEFGSEGNGDNNLYFPEDIATDGTYLFITDSGNHRIKKHDFFGTYISQFGTQGNGNDEYEFPSGLCIVDGTIYVADKGNSRVKHVSNTGVYINEYTTGLSFPEGVTFYNGRLAIVDSGNGKVVVVNANTMAYINEIGSYEFPSRSSITNNILTIVDRQANKLYFYDLQGNLLRTYDDGLFFPEGVVYANDKIYLCDSATDKVIVLNFIVESRISYYATQLLSLTKQLYPTGRAFWMKKGGVFYRLHEGLTQSEARCYSDAIGQLDIILPDNDGFTEEDATQWERSFGMITNTAVSLADRKAAITRKINYPGETKGRQSLVYIQSELQKAGFDVYVHENRFSDGIGGYEVISPNDIGTIDYQFGNSEFTYEFGGKITGVDMTEIIANYIDSELDAPSFEGAEFGVIEFGEWEFSGAIDFDDIRLRQTFFVCGQIFPSMAYVPLTRKREFRELLLKLKPAQMIGFLYIDYN